jgi:hypothetical protein
MTEVSVLMVGLQPDLIDFSDPAYAAFPGMTAEKVMAGLNADVARLTSLGYDTSLCLVDFGATAESVLRERLGEKPVDCVMLGAGLRLIAKNTALFEKLLAVVHRTAPNAAICFNTGPTDSAEAVGRWFPSPQRA